MKLFDRIRALSKTANDIAGEVSQEKQRLAQLKDERAAVATAPMPREDFEVWLDAQVDTLARQYPRFLQHSLRGIAKHPLDEPAIDDKRITHWASPRFAAPENPDFNHGPGADALVHLYGVQTFLAFVFGDEIKAAVRKAIEKMDCTGAGLPRAARLRRLRELDEEIAALERTLGELEEASQRLRQQI